VTSGPAVLLALGNAGVAVRPSRRREPCRINQLRDAATASRLLGVEVSADDLPALRRIQLEAEALCAQIAEGAAAPIPAEINRQAARAPGCYQLERDASGQLIARLRWRDTSGAARVARSLAHELAELEPRRLRRCQRPECDLFFYDTTRSNTQRWHSEDPCGWRERQRRRRAG
jgi:predicted RNA-binding Zn ribbon-like protein